MSQSQPLTTFALYRFTNPETSCDFPCLAVNEDRSVLLAVGDYRLSFEWDIGEAALEWLENDFKKTDEVLSADFLTLRRIFDAVFPSEVDFGIVTFDAALRPIRLGLSLASQASAEDSPEYAIEDLGKYERSYPGKPTAKEVTLAERAMLDVCVSTFTELATQCGTKLMESSPRYRSSTS